MGWTSFAKALNKTDFMMRLKGLKRVEKQIDVMKLIRKFFVLDVVTKHLIAPVKIALLRKKGKFIIKPDYVEDHKLSS